MREVSALFRLPTEFIGVEWTEDYVLAVDDDDTDEDIEDMIREDFDMWVDEKLADLRAYAEYEIL